MLETMAQMFRCGKVDAITAKEVAHFAELKFNEQEKIKGQIAKDLARIGVDAFMEPSAYTKLKRKYLAAHAGKKKLTILENMKREYCKE